MNLMSLLSNPTGLIESAKQFEEMAQRMLHLLEAVETNQRELMARMETLENAVNPHVNAPEIPTHDLEQIK